MDVKDTIVQLYRDYENRKLENVLNALPPDFCFEWPFDPRTARYSGICRSKDELLAELADLAANFQFNEYRATDIVVEGDRAAAQIQLDLTSVKTGRRFPARIAHFWSFRNGVPVHLVEYMDTALMAEQSGPRTPMARG
jgi:ketosteroid isomerase-like protein